jgi:DNA-binding GntR family transcriptional regulator
MATEKATMSNVERVEAKELEVWEGMFEVNEDYQRLICEECRVGVMLGFVGKHLKNKHRVRKVMAMKIEKHICAQHWD